MTTTIMVMIYIFCLQNFPLIKLLHETGLLEIEDKDNGEWNKKEEATWNDDAAADDDDDDDNISK